jgi:hypothetical protein
MRQQRTGCVQVRERELALLGLVSVGWLVRRVLPHFGRRRTRFNPRKRGFPYALTGFGSARRSASLWAASLAPPTTKGEQQ